MATVLPRVNTVVGQRRSKLSPRHPDFRHKKSKVALWLDNRHKPALVDSLLAMWDAGMQRPPAPVVEGQGAFGRLAVDHMEVEMCRKLCDDGRIIHAVNGLNILVQRGWHVPRNLFYRVLKRCTAQKDIVLGRRIHSLTVQSGYEGDAFLATHLIGMYASNRRLEEAMLVFTSVSTPDCFNWATIIFAYAKHGEAALAIQLYRHMLESPVKPDDRIHVAVLTACATAGDLVSGKQIHAQIVASPRKPNTFVQTSLVDMYAKCGCLEDARKVFDTISDRNVATWNAMLSGYSQHGMGQETLILYSGMQQGVTPPNCVTFVCLLQACASVGVDGLHQGKQLHAQIAKQGLAADVVLGTCLIDMYSKCGSLVDAHGVFDTLPARNIITWTAMIAGYVQQGMAQEALDLYSRMQQEGLNPPNSVTFVCLLQACASVGKEALGDGMKLHAQIAKQGLQDDVVVGGSLVNMYAKCGSLEDARSVFERLPARNIVTWTVIIAGYSQQGMGQEALTLYRSMQKEGLSPNAVTFVCLLKACGSVGVGGLAQGKQFHAQIAKRGMEVNLVLGTCLIDMYAKCGNLEEARGMFDGLPERDVIAWTTMIAGYAEQGMGQDALTLYSCMQREGITPSDSVTFLCLLQACASVAALPLGKQLHSQIEERGLQDDMLLCNSLVNMYAKCGSMSDSQRVFDSLPEKTVEAWGALIGGYALQGDGEVVFDLLRRMKPEGIGPNGITFVCVLTVCCHLGLVDKGFKYFDSMKTEHGIIPSIEHYVCMMDLLGRAGLLDEALKMAKTMPFPPTDVVWLTLLGACRKWNNVEIGRQVFEISVNGDAKDAAYYVLMSNIYASAHMWEEADKVDAMRKKVGARKKLGQSWWTDSDGLVHTFL